jgi:hypothetical protein
MNAWDKINNWDMWCVRGGLFVTHYAIFSNPSIQDGFKIDIPLN